MQTTMKKIAKLFVFAIAAMATLAACNKLEQTEQISKESQVLTAFNDNALTKTSLDGTSIVWATTDKVKAFTAAGAAFESTNTTVSENGAKAEFTFGTSNALAYAVYPSANAKAMASGAIDVVIPSSQTAVAGSFADGANTAIGAVEEDGTIYFKNIGALVSFDIKNDGIKSIMLSATPATSGYGFSGNANVTLANGEVSFTKNDGCEDVQLVGEFQKGSTYYMVVYPGTYKDLTLSFFNADNEVATYTNSTTLTLERNNNVCIFNQEIADSKWESAPEFKKVTSKPDDWSGQYLIVFEGATINKVDVSPKAFNGTLKTLDTNNNGIDVEIANSSIALDETTSSCAYAVIHEKMTAAIIISFFISIVFSALSRVGGAVFFHPFTFHLQQNTNFAVS